MNQVAFERGSPAEDADADSAQSRASAGTGVAVSDSAQVSSPVRGRPLGSGSSDWLIRKILVPTDYSNGSARAIARGVAIARQCEAGLTLLHVIDINRSGEPGTAQQMMQQLWYEGSAQMAQLACSLAGQVDAQTLLAEGIPWEVIIEKSGEFDLIVVAKSRREKGWRLCSKHTARRVIETGRCPVLVVNGEG